MLDRRDERARHRQAKLGLREPGPYAQLANARSQGGGARFVVARCGLLINA